MSTLKFNNIQKVYDNNVQAVFDFNLEIKDKEFIVFVGPSGCGKSTTLRMVAGLEDITSGQLYIDDVLMNDIEAKNRDIAMVFQNYALYPHMSVYDNMAFGLQLRHIDKAEIDRRIHSAAAILGLERYLARKPKALSGGQRQRVALGRAIVRSPKVFLMDEPLSNLDAKLRVQMRSEIAKIHEQVGATTIYVTHDQTEAMTMASRIVVMKDGYIQQIGTPKEVYNTPSNMFVAGFIGSPSMNFFRGEFDGNDFVLNGEKKLVIKLEQNQKQKIKDYCKNIIAPMKANIEQCIKDIQDIENEIKELRNRRRNKKKIISLEEELKENQEIIEKTKIQIGKLNENKFELVIGIRPEDIHTDTDKTDYRKSNSLQVMCDISELLGHESIVYGYIEEQSVVIKTNSSFETKLDEIINIYLDMDKTHLFDPFTTKRI